MTNRTPLGWIIRRTIWNSISIIIFKGKKAKPIPMPPKDPRMLRSVPLSERIPGVDIDNIQMADRIPPGETSFIMKLAFSLRIWMYTAYPPVKHGLPQIADDINVAMKEAYSKAYRKVYPAPKLPDEFHHAAIPDLGRMAVASPYACFLHKDDDGKLVWDFTDLDKHEIYAGLRPLGCKVFFKLNKKERTLEATRITCVLGDIASSDSRWREAVRTAMCAASTQVSLVNHFNWVHLACGGPLSIATRNHLYRDHPLCRLMWPHMFGTQNSNYLVTKGQMLKGGDFETTFSFTHQGMCDLFERTYDAYNATVTVPHLDWQDRGLPKDAFDTPVQDNQQDLYDVMLAHTKRYIHAYYDSDEALRWDESVQAWIHALNERVPNGIDVILGDKITRDSVASLCAGFIYMASVQHEALGSLMWNYQMWVDKNPVRIHASGKRIPVDIFQRLLNANFNLNVDRAKLMQDLSYFALDEKGRAIFLQFEQDLKALDRKYAAEGDACWRVTPSMLDANINA